MVYYQNESSIAEDELEEQETERDDCMVLANETALISVAPLEINNEKVNIPPCEGKQSMPPMLIDSNCEELAHLYLFPTGNFGYKGQSCINLTSSNTSIKDF